MKLCLRFTEQHSSQAAAVTEWHARGFGEGRAAAARVSYVQGGSAAGEVRGATGCAQKQQHELLQCAV